MPKTLTEIPVICVECGTYLGSYVCRSTEPMTGPVVLRFCSGSCAPAARDIFEEEQREAERQRHIVQRLFC